MPGPSAGPGPSSDVLTHERPFPGPKPYVEAWKDYYHGRETEIADVLHLIRRGPLGVLFGASGLGKTSLLNAGVLPKLREEEFFPIVVRFDFEQPKVSLIEQVMQGVRAEAARRNQAAKLASDKITVEKAASCPTLWEYFKTVELWSHDWRLLTPVVVIDQFEEVFTLGQRTPQRREAVIELFGALRDVAENHTPDTLARDPRFRGRSARAADAPRVRLVLSLREDYLSHLEAHRRDMPSVMRDRFWLRPMTRQQAADTVVKIAPHLLTRDDAKHLVDAVASSRGAAAATTPASPDDNLVEQLDVEPSLLNLFCYQLNEVRLDPRASHGRVAKGIDRELITKAKSDIIRNFYADCLRGFDDRVRAFVEDSLISQSARGYRELVRWEVALEAPGITAPTLTELENRRLLRRELRGTSAFVELVHDVLIEPIRQARDARRSARFRWRVAGLSSLVAISSLGLSTFIARDVKSPDSVIGELLGYTERLAAAKRDLLKLREVQAQLQGERAQNQRAVDELRIGIADQQQQLADTKRNLDAEKARAVAAIAQALASERAKLEESRRALAQSLERQKAEDLKLQKLAQEQQILDQSKKELEAKKKQLEYEIKVLNIQTGLPPR